VREFERELAVWEHLVQQSADGFAPEPPDGTVLLIADANGVVQRRGARIPYLPGIRPAQVVSSTLFAEAEADEFRRQELDHAAAAYKRLTDSPSLPIRAAALIRLARVLRKQERYREAVDVYGSLAELGDVPVAGSPAALVAGRERMVLFKAMGQHANAALEANQLGAVLGDGRFAIDRATFEFHREAATSESVSSNDRNAPLALAEAVEALWPDVTSKPSGRADWSGGSGAFIAVWRRTGARSAAVVGSADTFVTRVRGAVPLTERWSLEDSGGREISGRLPVDEIALRKTFRETGLPWTIRMAAADGAADRTFASRRNLFAASLGLMVLIIAASSYFVFRAVNRELRVARLQSDFVAAVSHEFRMCHLTELLEEGEAPPGRIAQYHQVLAKESRRLHAMVENLLDFGRIEAGRRTYELTDVDANAFVAEVVREFREQRADEGSRVHLTAAESNAAALIIRVDRSALAVVLRNLLDNAIKYSPALGRVGVSVRPEGAFVGIAVDDEGPGVSKAESQEIFRKFTRGAAARTMNVKGTGIGLTLAAEIVRAHGGRLEVESEPGRGSRFTTLLPLQPAQS
jgi:signal transduction histidine kinase